MSRPRAADDFPMIRSRMVELRRDRDRALAGEDARPAIGPRPYHRPESSKEDHEGDRLLPRSFRKFVR